ncbi:MAG: hypothetical protein QOD30_124, partial [Actinomycetota bacterium]|nr:hypothetical protein [Actinomycetota bacterium]
KLLTEELGRVGRKIDSHYELSSLFDQSGMDAAVLRFRGDGVTHVIAESLFLLLFPQSAESQKYRPRYLVSTTNALTLVQASAPPAQLAGALGAGFFPSYDVDTAHDPGPVSPEDSRCRAANEAAGHDTSQRNAFNLMVKACDGFNFLAATAAIGGLSPEGIWNGTHALGAMTPAGAFAISFAGGRLDGPAAVRDVGYDGTCRCFQYLSAENHPM